MNAEVIRRAVNVRPEQMNMDDWYTETDCGTAGCIAGNCVMQNPLRGGDTKHAAREFMDITYVQGERLFYIHNWPGQFWAEFPDGETWVIDANGNKLSPGTPEYLERVKQRVELFIESGGAE